MTLSGAMALRRIGVAPAIVHLAFGLLLGAVAVAAEQWRAWMEDFRQRR